MSPPEGLASRNAILGSLPDAELASLLPSLELRRIALGMPLIEPGQPIEDVWFPLSGVASVVTESEDGTSVEVATIGRDGIVGADVFLGIWQIPQRVMCQVQGQALAGPAAEILAGPASARLADAARKYVHTVMTQAAQGVLCNKMHPLEQRAARWLLSVHDRLDADSFYLTHDYFATMLGSHRPSVTIAAGMLREAGLITYSRGDIRILDRPGLEAAACECYSIVASDYATTMNDAASQVWGA